MTSAYNFEDLKVGMWVYDKLNKDTVQIIAIYENKEIECNLNEFRRFSEDRFYPPGVQDDKNN